MKKLIAANWKENPKTEKSALKLFREVASAKRDGVRVALCPPFIYLEGVARAFGKMRGKSDLALGAQDAFWEERGPFTSEVGPRMLRSLGMSYVIVGHSERRKWLKETDEMINKKIKLVLKDGLKVILCVGEPLVIRKKGIPAARTFVATQLKKDLKNIKSNQVIVAYEPIWAIGTGRYDDPEDVREMAEFIKRTVAQGKRRPIPMVLYGGSVNSKNVQDYVQYNSIDGALVGGASLKSAEFKKIIKNL
jgi:triosephosphate isomerase